MDFYDDDALSSASTIEAFDNNDNDNDDDDESIFYNIYLYISYNF